MRGEGRGREEGRERGEGKRAEYSNKELYINYTTPYVSNPNIKPLL